MFRHLVASVKDYAIFILDPTGRVASWNAGAERFKGYTEAEILGRHFSVFYPERDIAAGKCEMELEVAARVGRFEDEGWRVRKDGSEFWANVVITALRDPDGGLIGFGKVTRDLTERKRAEDVRFQEQERFRRLIESIRDYAIYRLDPDGMVMTWNAGAEQIKGYAASEVIGTHFSRFYPEADVLDGKCERELEIAARVGRFEDEDWRVRKDGTQFWANVIITAIHDDDGALEGFSKVTRDLTDRKRSEEERTARLAAERASRSKDEFLAMLGHELRNPLAPIVSAVQLMKLRGDSKLVRELQVIERQTRQMTRIVDDLLDVSRVSQGKIVLQTAPIDVRDVVAKAAEIAIPLFEKKGQHFEVNSPPRAVVIEGDDGRLVQVFTNLLTNASKYTPEGGHIFLMIRQAGSEIIVEVRDDGVGIAPELLRRVFELFVQGDQGSHRPNSGLGLGLTLVRALVELHGGTVEARSAGLGFGSSFIVRLAGAEGLPPAVSDDRITAVYGASPSKRSILLVDDNEDARDLLADLLRKLGHDVRTAGDGPSALAVLEAFDAQVAVLDIGLPGMDGCELAVRIRAKHRTMRLLALSGYGQPIDHARTREAGFSAHLVKPIDVHTLLDHILASG